MAKFGVLNVLYTKVANDKYFSHILPRLVKCLVKIVDNYLIPCSASKYWWLKGATVFIFILNLLNK